MLVSDVVYIQREDSDRRFFFNFEDHLESYEHIKRLRKNYQIIVEEYRFSMGN